MFGPPWRDSILAWTRGARGAAVSVSAALSKFWQGKPRKRYENHSLSIRRTCFLKGFRVSRVSKVFSEDLYGMGASWVWYKKIFKKKSSEVEFSPGVTAWFWYFSGFRTRKILLQAHCRVCYRKHTKYHIWLEISGHLRARSKHACHPGRIFFSRRKKYKNPFIW